MFFIGGVFAVVMRLELLTPKGDLVSADTYNKMFTMHGIVMVFFFLIPSIPATLGNFLVPLMIGAKDLAFPGSTWRAGTSTCSAPSSRCAAMLAGGVDTGWTFYTPLSTRTAHTQVMPTGVGVLIIGFSSILTALNFMVTIHRMRAPGLTWFRLPLFIWAMYATSIDHHAGHAGDRHHPPPGRHRAASGASASSTRRWAAIRCCSSTCSGSTRTRPSTS